MASPSTPLTVTRPIPLCRDELADEPIYRANRALAAALARKDEQAVRLGNWRDYLATFVPLMMLEYQRAGGPTELDWEWTRWFNANDMQRADEGMYGGPSEARRRFRGGIVRAVAILSFAPGGVRFLGFRFSASGEE